MATNLDVITEAYQLANLINERETLSATKASTGLTLLNDMMSDWEQDGIELGYFPQTSLAGTIPVDDNDLRGIKYNLSRGTAGFNGVDTPPETMRIAELTLARLEKATREIVESDFSHMPSGLNNVFDISTGSDG